MTPLASKLTGKWSDVITKSFQGYKKYVNVNITLPGVFYLQRSIIINKLCSCKTLFMNIF